MHGSTPSIRRIAAGIVLLAGAWTGEAAQAITGGAVHAGFIGTWVPASAACTSPLRIVIASDRVTFVNGTQQADYRKLEQCFSCAGHDVQGITMLSTDAMGDSPFMITLDESKPSRKTLSVDFSNDRRLGVRFPFGSGALKQCR